MLGMSQLCGRAVKKVHITLDYIYAWIMPGLPDFKMGISQTSEQPKEGRAWKPRDVEVFRNWNKSGLKWGGR